MKIERFNESYPSPYIPSNEEEMVLSPFNIFVVIYTKI